MDNSAKALVSKAWVLLDQNNISRMHILFNEDPDENLPEGVRPQVGMFVHEFPNHVVMYGNIDETGKYWSSRAGVVNRDFGMEIIDVTVVSRKYRGMGRSTAVTKAFAEEILKEFNLPFHFVLTEDSPSDKKWALVQNDTSELVGKTVTAYNTWKGTTEKVKIIETHLSEYDVEKFTVRTKEGTRYYSFNELRNQYKGIFWDAYQEELKQLGIRNR